MECRGREAARLFVGERSGPGPAGGRARGTQSGTCRGPGTGSLPGVGWETLIVLQEFRLTRRFDSLTLLGDSPNSLKVGGFLAGYECPRSTIFRVVEMGVFSPRELRRF